MMRVPRTSCSPAYPTASCPGSPVAALKASRSSQGPVANSTACDMSRCERARLCIATRWGALRGARSRPHRLHAWLAPTSYP